MGIVGADRLESVLAADQRVAVRRPTVFPWSAVCHVEARFPSGAVLSGSGALVGPQHLLTAAHCVHDLRLGGEAQHVRVSPGRYLHRTAAPVTTSTRIVIPSPWRRRHVPWADVAVVILDEPVGLRTGWFRLRYLDARRLRRALVNVAGYPLDLPRDAIDERGKVMYWAVGRIVRVRGTRLWHLADTYYGQSGGPVWVFRSPDRRYLVGVHTSGAQRENSGIWINAKLSRRLRQLLRGRPRSFVAWR